MTEKENILGSVFFHSRMEIMCDESTCRDARILIDHGFEFQIERRKTEWFLEVVCSDSKGMIIVIASTVEPLEWNAPASVRRLIDIAFVRLW